MTKPVLFLTRAPSLSGTALSMAHLNPEPGSFTTKMGSGGVPMVFWPLSRWDLSYQEASWLAML